MTGGPLAGPVAIVALELIAAGVELDVAQAHRLAVRITDALVDEPGAARAMALEALERDTWQPR